MFERFTPEARAVIVRAQRAAVRRGERKIGTAHLLLALCEEPVTSQAGALLGQHDVTVQTVTEHLAELGFGDSEGNPRVSGHIPFTGNVKRAFEGGLGAANRKKSRAIEPIHLLLGLAALTPSTAGTILTAHGVDADAGCDD